MSTFNKINCQKPLRNKLSIKGDLNYILAPFNSTFLEIRTQYKNLIPYFTYLNWLNIISINILFPLFKRMNFSSFSSKYWSCWNSFWDFHPDMLILIKTFFCYVQILQKTNPQIKLSIKIWCLSIIIWRYI